MSKGRTIALNLYDHHLEVLDRLAKKHGSRSAAAQRLLEEESRRQVYEELGQAYEEYLKTPGAMEAERKLTEEMLDVASWPAEWKKGRRGGGKTIRGV